MALADKILTLPEFQVKKDDIISCNGLGFKNLLQAGLTWLEAHLKIVNALNVFPVPDGDTGINLVLTMRAALAAIGPDVADNNVCTLAGKAAQGALMGARGNSGVILSQFFEGLALGLSEQATLTAEYLAVGVKSGAALAYQSVLEPVEGTILTVMRATAEAAQRTVKDKNDLRTVLTEMVKAARQAQATTPDLLPVLKQAGVTDAGGQGFLYVLEGALRLLNGEPLTLEGVDDKLTPQAGDRLQPLLPPAEGYGYDVQFLIHGEGLGVATIRADIDQMGQSTLVVGDEQRVRVHVHTHDPGTPLSYGVRQGVISDVVVENMQAQAIQFAHSHLVNLPQPNGLAKNGVEPAKETAILAAVAGPGFARLFQSLGITHILAESADVQEWLRVINQFKAEKILVLPNSQEALAVVQQIKSLPPKKVAVVPTQTLPAGIAALLSFNHEVDFLINAQRMAQAAAQVQTIEMTQAVEAGLCNKLTFKKGDMLGFVNRQLIQVGSTSQQVLLDVLRQQQMSDYELITFYFGEGISPAQTDSLVGEISLAYPELDFEIYEGGQPHYHYIISLE